MDAASFVYSYALGGNTFAIVALILSLLGALALVLFFLPRANKGKFGAAADAVHDFFNFNKGWSRGLIKFAYVFLTIFLILLGFYLMFAASFMMGVLCFAALLVLRVSFEVILALLDMRDNVRAINAKMPTDPNAPIEPEEATFWEKLAKKQAQKREAYARYQQEQAEAMARTQAEQQTENAAEEARFCSNCGSRLKAEGAYCPECGAKVEP